MFKNQAGVWVNTSKTRKMIGPSLTRGARVAGSVRFQPFFNVWINKNA
jgi:hypothetical protein